MAQSAPPPDFRRILAHYPSACQPTGVSPRLVEGFSGARVWKVETVAGVYALRATNASVVDQQRLAGLHRLIRHVRHFGLEQVPVPVETAAGATFFEDGGAVWQLEGWMPGFADFSACPTLPRLEAALECLARWHLAAERFEPSGQELAWFFKQSSAPSPGLAERAQELTRWGQPERALLRRHLELSAWKEFAALGLRILEGFQRRAASCAAELKLGLAIPVPLQPCLRDIWHDHLLFTGEDLTGLIDPHAARSDSVAADLARLLGSLVGEDPSDWERGLAAYERIRPLSLDESALVGLFDRSAMVLSGMTWLEWHCLEQRVFPNPNKVLARLQAIVARLESWPR